MGAKTLRQWAGLAPVSSLVPEKTALLLIDVQMDYFTPGKLLIPDGEAMVRRAAELREWAREKGVSIVHIQQVSKAESPIFAAGSDGIAFHPAVMPVDGETVIEKGLPSSFRGTTLQEFLQSGGIDTLIVCGLMTHMCVETTTRDAASMGYKVIVISDACASRNLPAYDGNGEISHGDIHRGALTAMSDRFADILTLDALKSIG